MIDTFLQFLLWCLGVDTWGVTHVSGVELGLLHGHPAVFFIAAALGLVLSLVCYARTTESISRCLRALLVLLRTLSVALIGFGVLGGWLRVEVVRDARQVIALAVDASGSMRVADMGGRSRLDAARDALAASPSLGELSRRYVLHGYALGHRSPAAVLVPPEASRARGKDTGSGSRGDLPAPFEIPTPVGLSPLAEDAQRIISRYGAGELRGLVVLTDGNDTSAGARPPMPRDTPVIAVPLGRPVVRDVRITRVEAPGYVYVHDTLVVCAVIEQRGLAGQPVTVSLAVDGKVESGSEQTKPLPESRVPLKICFVSQPKEPGLRKFTVQVRPLDGEATALNNTQSVYVDVRPEKIRVLYVEGTVRWEYRHLKDVLATDPAVRTSFLVRTTGDDWLTQGFQERNEDEPAREGDAGAGQEGGGEPAAGAPKKPPEFILKNPARGFPSDRRELMQFDVMILGDVPRKYLEGAPLQSIYEFVKERGGGLATLGGLQVYSAGNYETSLLNQMLPVVIQDEEEDQFEGRFRAVLTPAGALHPAMQLEWDPAENGKAWAALPLLEGGNVLSRARPGAVVLARHEGEPGRILMAAHKFYEGRVFSTGLDTTWRWRIGRKDENAPNSHQRFWNLLLRWLARNPHLRGQSETLFTDVNQYHVGSPITLMARLLDADFNPVDDADVEFVVQSPGGRVVRHTPRASLLTPGLYSCSFVPEETGTHQLMVRWPRPDGSEHLSQVRVDVEENPRELRDPGVDDAGLRGWAGETGGQILPIEELSRLPHVIGAPTKSMTEIRSIDVRRSWVFPGLAVLLLGVEWFFRKRRGLS
jgi:uncharacterized membrane protein